MSETARTLTRADAELIADVLEERGVVVRRVPPVDRPCTVTPEQRAAAREKALRTLKRRGVGWPR